MMKTPLQTYYHLQILQIKIISFVIQELTMRSMFRVRMVGNTYDFKGILSLTYTTWILAKQTWKIIVTSTL